VYNTKRKNKKGKTVREGGDLIKKKVANIKNKFSIVLVLFNLDRETHGMNEWKKGNEVD